MATHSWRQLAAACRRGSLGQIRCSTKVGSRHAFAAICSGAQCISSVDQLSAAADRQREQVRSSWAGGQLWRCWPHGDFRSFKDGFRRSQNSRCTVRIVIVLSCAHARCYTFSLVAVEACLVLSACPEHAVSVRTMLLLYGEATTTFNGFIYGRSGSRTLTSQLLLSSPGGYGCVKVTGIAGCANT